MTVECSKTLKPMPQANWKAEFPDQMLVFEEKRKLEKPDKKALGAEKKTNHKLKSDRISDWSKPELDPRPYCWRASASSLRHPNPQPLTRKEISTSRLNVLLLTCFCHSDSAPLGLISTKQTGNALEKYKKN